MLVNMFDPLYHYNLGNNCYNNDFIDEAIKHYNRALKLDPEHIKSLFGLALVYEYIGKTSTAICYYKRILELDKDYLAAYNNLGALYMRINNYLGAIDSFKTALNIDAGYHRCVLGLALAYEKQRCYVKALHTYNDYCLLRPKSRNAQYVRRQMYKLLETMKEKGDKMTNLTHVSTNSLYDRLDKAIKHQKNSVNTVNAITNSNYEHLRLNDYFAELNDKFNRYVKTNYPELVKTFKKQELEKEKYCQGVNLYNIEEIIKELRKRHQDNKLDIKEKRPSHLLDALRIVGFDPARSYVKHWMPEDNSDMSFTGRL